MSPIRLIGDKIYMFLCMLWQIVSQANVMAG